MSEHARCLGCRAPFPVSDMRRLSGVVVDSGVGVDGWRCRTCDDLWMLHRVWCFAHGRSAFWYEGIFKNGGPSYDGDGTVSCV